MTWSHINRTRIPWPAKIWTWLLCRVREPQCAITCHTLTCPSHDCSATVTVRTRLRTRRRRHADIRACSLLPVRPVVPPSEIVWAPDPPYYDLHLRETEQSPRYTPKVWCRKKYCLRLLSDAVEVGRIQ